MADVPIGTTQVGNWIPTNFASMIEGFVRSNLSLQNSMADKSAWSTGSGTVKFPITAALTAVAKTSETKLTEHISGGVEAVGTIPMSTQYAIPLVFELIAMKQVAENIDLQMDYASRGAYALRKVFETSLVGKLMTATTNDVTLATANTILWSSLLKAWGKLGDLNIAPVETSVGMTGTAWGLSVADWGVNYTSASNIGNNQNFLQTGVWGKIGQSNLYVLSDWDSAATGSAENGTMWAKDAVAWAIQGGVDVLGPVPSVLYGGYELGLYMNFGSVLAVNAFAANFNSPA